MTPSIVPILISKCTREERNKQEDDVGVTEKRVLELYRREMS
jgi:hypothetical protein